MLYATSEVNRFHLKLGDYYFIKGCDIMEIALLLIFQCRPTGSRAVLSFALMGTTYMLPVDPIASAQTYSH